MGRGYDTISVGLTCGARVREGASLGRHGTYRSHCFRCSEVGLSGGFCLASCEQDGGGKAETPILKGVGRGYDTRRTLDTCCKCWLNLRRKGEGGSIAGAPRHLPVALLSLQ